MTTTVMLPHPKTGAEIIEAFRNAASFQDSPDSRWQAKRFILEHARAYPVDVEGKPTGIRATIAWRKTRGQALRFLGLQGETWKTHPLSLEVGVRTPLYGEFANQITLFPIYRSHEYHEVTLEAYTSFFEDPGSLGTYSACTYNIDGKEFEHLRPAYDRILADFYARCAV